MAASGVTRALVVGGTNGIGFGIACRIASEAPSTAVIISGRTRPAQIPHANIEFRPLDASSMRAIKAYTDAYKAAKEPQLDLLVMTQGIMTVAGRTETAGEGIDNKMSLHYYGRQLLIRELMPSLKDDAKVLIVLDSKRGRPEALNWDDLDLKNNFTVAGAADHCMAMNDAMIQHYAAEQQAAQQQGSPQRNIHFVHAYPGLVKTNVGNNLPWYLRLPAAALTPMQVPVETCAEYLLKGTFENAESGAKEGRAWSCIDNKGHLIKQKATWSKAGRQHIADHTWKITDEAIQVGK